MSKQSYKLPARNGAALIISIVLLTVIGVVAGLTVPQIVRSRQAAQWELHRIQTRLLIDDALRNAESKRASDPDFSGETLTLEFDRQPFLGTFRVTTRLENDEFAAEVEYQDSMTANNVPVQAGL